MRVSIASDWAKFARILDAYGAFESAQIIDEHLKLASESNNKSKVFKKLAENFTPTMPESYYSLFALNQNATPQEIDAAFLNYSQVVAANPSQMTPDGAQKILTAYETLKDPTLRSQYDASLQGQNQSSFWGNVAGGVATGLSAQSVLTDAKELGKSVNLTKNNPGMQGGWLNKGKALQNQGMGFAPKPGTPAEIPKGMGAFFANPKVIALLKGVSWFGVGVNGLDIALKIRAGEEVEAYDWAKFAGALLSTPGFAALAGPLYPAFMIAGSIINLGGADVARYLGDTGQGLNLFGHQFIDKSDEQKNKEMILNTDSTTQVTDPDVQGALALAAPLVAQGWKSKDILNQISSTYPWINEANNGKAYQFKQHLLALKNPNFQA